VSSRLGRVPDSTKCPSAQPWPLTERPPARPPARRTQLRESRQAAWGRGAEIGVGGSGDPASGPLVPTLTLITRGPGRT